MRYECATRLRGQGRCCFGARRQHRGACLKGRGRAAVQDRTNDVLRPDSRRAPSRPESLAGFAPLPAGDAHLRTITPGTARRSWASRTRPCGPTPPPRLRDAPPLSRSAPSGARPHVRPRLSPRTFDEPSSPPSPPTPTARGRSPLPTSPPPRRPSHGRARLAGGVARRGAAAGRRARVAERRDARRGGCYIKAGTAAAAAAALLGLREDPRSAAGTAAVAAAVAAADDRVLEEARDDPWWGASPPGLAMRRKPTPTTRPGRRRGRGLVVGLHDDGDAAAAGAVVGLRRRGRAAPAALGLRRERRVALDACRRRGGRAARHGDGLAGRRRRRYGFALNVQV